MLLKGLARVTIRPRQYLAGTIIRQWVAVITPTAHQGICEGDRSSMSKKASNSPEITQIMWKNNVFAKRMICITNISFSLWIYFLRFSTNEQFHINDYSWYKNDIHCKSPLHKLLPLAPLTNILAFPACVLGQGDSAYLRAWGEPHIISYRKPFWEMCGAEGMQIYLNNEYVFIQVKNTVAWPWGSWTTMTEVTLIFWL